MAMEQWSPFRDALSLRDAMDRLFQSSYVSPRGLMSGQSGTTNGMPLDVTEHDNGYQIEASMPGVNPDDVQITVQGDTLTIRGEVNRTENINPEQQGQQSQQGQQAQQSQQTQTQASQSQTDQAHAKQHTQGQQGQQGQQRHHEHPLARERFYGTYFRQVTLPTTVNADKAKAHFKNGILYLTLPKAEEAKPRQIPVSQSQEVHHILTPAEQRQQQQQQPQTTSAH